MATIFAKSSSNVVAARTTKRQAVKVQAALKPSVKAAPAVSTASANQMMVWQPVNNKQFETFSYLPPLNSDQIARQVDYIVSNGWIPCLEFSAAENAYVSNDNTVRFGPVSCLYYDNRYWTMWKLPMFGCSDPSAVLNEISRCSRAFPQAYVRLVAFDNIRQVQIMSFLVQRPKGAADYCPVERRSVA
jgi:ribulose-bisphosphate carboxylase small chain